MSDVIEAPVSIRQKVFNAETIMKQMPQLELAVKHYFSLGLYARELYIPANSTIVGKLHKFPQLNILSQGELLVLVDEEIQRIKAPFIVSSPAGTKRIAYAVQDSVWVTIHATDETDVDLIEKHFIAQSEEEYIKFCNDENKQIKLLLGWD